jgi:hypothetical protein
MPLIAAGEWARASWTYQPVTLSHTPSTIIRAIHSVLTQTGWEYATWSGTGDDRSYLRKDRRFLNVTNDNVGAAGNTTITKVGANINVISLAGGSGSVKATGSIELVAQPADGNTVTMSDGVTTVTFEFDNNATVTGGNVLVTIGTKIIDTIGNLLAAINANAFNITASRVSDVWRYNGDTVEQNCGLRVFNNTGSARIEISAILENVAGTAVQVETTTTGHSSQNQKCLVSYNNSLPNDWLFYCGEDGFYYEVGTSGIQQNIGHGYVATFMPIPEFAGTRDAARMWASQGLCMNLFGTLVFSQDRQLRFVDTNGANKNHTAALRPFVARGSSNLISPVVTNAPAFPIAPRDNLIGAIANPSPDDAVRYLWFCTFGVRNSPLDDRYKICPMWLIQDLSFPPSAVFSLSWSNNVGPASGYYGCEPRWLRYIPRLVAVDQTLIPFTANVTDITTGKIYRIAQVADGGRNSNIGIEYPSAVITIPITPTV